MTQEQLIELRKAGYEGRMQWAGYRKSYHDEIPNEDDWCRVYANETDGMIRTYGPDRFRIKPVKLQNQ